MNSALRSWVACVILLSTASVSGADKDPVVVATRSGDLVTIESRGTPGYRVAVDLKGNGLISELRLPADGPVVARELNDVFFLGKHDEEFSLRGWTNKPQCIESCTGEITSQQPSEVAIRLHVVAKGTFKFLGTDEQAKVEWRKTHTNYHDKTVELSRTYRFRPDRILVDDQMTWVHPELDVTTFYFTSAMMPGQVQGPLRLVNGTTSRNLLVTSSGGDHVPEGIVVPCVAENYLKNGFKIALQTTATSFDVTKSDFYFYERPFQQDWFQLSGFMYRVKGIATGEPIRSSHELVFSKVPIAEMPPIVTITSPGWETRWLDEKDEVSRYRIGDELPLKANAVNSDGSRVPDDDITWEIRIFPWKNTPIGKLRGNNLSYRLPEVADEEDKLKSDGRSLVAWISVTARGNNGVEAVEPFAMLVGRAGEKTAGR